MRVGLIVIGTLLIFIKSCTLYHFMDFSMWKFDAKRASSFDSTKIKFRTDGYYYRDQEEEGRLFNQTVLIFYKSGYFCCANIWYVDGEDYFYRNVESYTNQFFEWGRYETDGQKIFVQFFGRNVIASGGLPIRYWKIVELHGNVVNDTTLFFSLRRVQKNGHFEDIRIDRTFRFTKYDSLPPSDNWLMEEFKEK